MLNNLVRQGLENNKGYAALANVLEKEILHHDILSVMSDNQLFTELTFIGGTALRLCYDSTRLSEDLDFAAAKDFDVKNMLGFGNEIETYLNRKYQLHVQVKEPQQTDSDTSTWKVSIVKPSSRADIPAQKIHIDICSVPSLHTEFAGVKNHYGLPVATDSLLIAVQTRKEILADKFIALAFRNRLKPRDLWDILWLKQQGELVSISDIIKKLELRCKTFDMFEHNIQSVMLKLATAETHRKEFIKEMSRFIPEKIANRTINNPDYWPYLKKEVKMDVSNILNEIKSPNLKTQFDMGL